jgi:hypothetical protein
MAERSYGLVPVDLITICRELDELAWLLDHDHLKPRFVTFEDGDESVSEERVDDSIRTACQRVLMLIPGNPDFADCSIEQRGFLKALRQSIADPVSLTAHTIRGYIRFLTPRPGGNNVPAVEGPEKQAPEDSTGNFLKLLKAITGDVADEKFRKAAEAIGGSGTVNDKLSAIHRHVGIPSSVSATQLGTALGVSANAIKKSLWWKENRYGRADERIEDRRSRHKEWAAKYENGVSEDDE